MYIYIIYTYLYIFIVGTWGCTSDLLEILYRYVYEYTYVYIYIYVLRKAILGSSSQPESHFVRAVCEKLFPEKLASEPGCLREAVLENPFSERLFYESHPRSCSGRSCSTRCGSIRGLWEKQFCEWPWHSKNVFWLRERPTPKMLLLLSPHVLRTKTTHTGSRLRNNNHN